MEQFTPDGGRPSMKAAPIELLLATDLLSEGLNLQRASVVVHLDLPWNPARLDQRVGRVRRMGSLHDSVAVYIMDPVGAGGAVRQVEERLRAKLRIARDTIGAADGILPRDSPASDATSRTGAAEALGEIQRVLERWQDVGAATTPAGADAPILVAAVRASARGWLCAYDSGTDPRLLAEIDGRVGDDTLHIQAALDHGAGSQVNADPSHVRECVEAARGWIAGRRAARAVDLRAGLTSRIRRDLLSRLAHVVARSPRHRRAAVTRSAELARRAVTMPLGLGAEQALHELVATAQSDHEWLAAVAAFAEANGQQPGGDAARDDGVIAMVVFGGPARSDNA